MLPLGLILLTAALMVMVVHFFRARQGFPPFALECFVMYVSASALLHWERPVVESPAVAQRSGRQSRLGIAVVIGLAVLLGYCAWPAPARAAGLDLPPEAERGLHLLYSGQPEAALAEFRKIEAAQPDHPLGYLLEAEQRWWQIYCEACEIKWNMVDAWYRPKLPADDAYLALTDKGASLAEARIAQADSAEMRFYAGMAYALARPPVGFARRAPRHRPRRRSRPGTFPARLAARSRNDRRLHRHRPVQLLRRYALGGRQDPAIFHGHSRRRQRRRHPPAANCRTERHRHARRRTFLSGERACAPTIWTIPARSKS